MMAKPTLFALGSVSGTHTILTTLLNSLYKDNFIRTISLRFGKELRTIYGQAEAYFWVFSFFQLLVYDYHITFGIMLCQVCYIRTLKIKNLNLILITIF